MTTPPTPTRPERVASGVLVERARAEATAPWASAGAARERLLTALADRLAELAALEPVGELLAVMRRLPTPRLTVEESEGGWFALLAWGDAVANVDWDSDIHEHTFAEAHADTPEAALVALAALVEGRVPVDPKPPPEQPRWSPTDA